MPPQLRRTDIRHLVVIVGASGLSTVVVQPDMAVSLYKARIDPKAGNIQHLRVLGLGTDRYKLALADENISHIGRFMHGVIDLCAADNHISFLPVCVSGSITEIRPYAYRQRPVLAFSACSQMFPRMLQL